MTCDPADEAKSPFGVWQLTNQGKVRGDFAYWP